MIPYDKCMANTSELGFIDISHIDLSGDKPKLVADFTRLAVEFEEGQNLPPGTCLAHGLLAGTCGSEDGYYRKPLPKYDGGTRFQYDLANSPTQEQYLDRTMAFGFTPDPDVRQNVQNVMIHSPFHEGVVQVDQVRPDNGRPRIPVVVYRPGMRSDGSFGMVQTYVDTNFQDIRAGEMAVLNPAFVCDDHTRADTPSNEEAIRSTGWPIQCTRDHSCNGHVHRELKATRGHTQAIGTATEGKMPIGLRTMTPVSEAVQRLSNGNPIIPGQYEVMGCIGHANGFLLASGRQPEVVVIQGDGYNALNMALWYSIASPNARIIIAGKTPEKLTALQQVNPDQITTVTVNGKGNDEIRAALRDISPTGKADLVVPMIALAEDAVSSLVKEGGDVIWWAAAVSEHIGDKEQQNAPYTNHHPYGGAPAAEYTADALFTWVANNRPEMLDPFFTFPGAMYVDMGPDAAQVVMDWFNNGARWADPKTGISQKPFIRMGEFAQKKAA